jgi:hypothetical protein
MSGKGVTLGQTKMVLARQIDHSEFNATCHHYSSLPFISSRGFLGWGKFDLQTVLVMFPKSDALAVLKCVVEFGFITCYIFDRDLDRTIYQTIIISFL